MKGKGSETSSSSLVIISRRVLVTVIAGISLFSFGLGYFFGYGGTSATKMVKHVEADSKIVASQERTVLDSTGKPTMVAPPVIPGAVPKEPPLKQKIEEGTKPSHSHPWRRKNRRSPPMHRCRGKTAKVC
jgi:hypothetical protein